MWRDIDIRRRQNIACCITGVLCALFLGTACTRDSGSAYETDADMLPDQKITDTAVVQQPMMALPFSVPSSDVAYIVTQNGKTGARFRWDDAETVQRMTELLNGFSYTETGEILEGWTARMVFFSAEDEELLQVTVSGNQVTCNGVRYIRTTSGGDMYFDDAFLAQYFNDK